MTFKPVKYATRDPTDIKRLVIFYLHCLSYQEGRCNILSHTDFIPPSSQKECQAFHQALQVDGKKVKGGFWRGIFFARHSKWLTRHPRAIFILENQCYGEREKYGTVDGCLRKYDDTNSTFSGKTICDWAFNLVNIRSRIYIYLKIKCPLVPSAWQ